MKWIAEADTVLTTMPHARGINHNSDAEVDRKVTKAISARAIHRGLKAKGLRSHFDASIYRGVLVEWRGDGQRLSHGIADVIKRH